MLTFATIWCVFLLDLILGDPRWLPHPVRIIGQVIDRLEIWVRGWAHDDRALRLGGCLMTLLVVAGSFILTWLLIAWFSLLGATAGAVVAVLLGYTTIAIRDLYDQSWAVIKALRAENLPEARRLLSMIVGRDTKDLDSEGIQKAVIETVAENLSDGVVSPLFYMAIGGVPLAMAFKASSTLDSMVGYRDERYEHLGWCSARLDDVLNFIPARLTGVLIVAAAFVLRLDASRAWTIFRRDGGKHKSPNAGRPEAAMAGALGIQLGGPSVYEGVLVEKPYLGDPDQLIDIAHTRQAEQILFVVSVLMVLPASLYRLVL
ncbi:MAG: cobalamin biosynthesis protein CobD [Deltaproteobacteria bacterium]|nr:cobalamin biosynthesis protein CobD [Deltaproteobacteria bacterium]